MSGNREKIRDEMARRANAWSSPQPSTAPHDFSEIPLKPIQHDISARSSNNNGPLVVATNQSIENSAFQALRNHTHAPQSMEGPLPPEVRSLIYRSVQGDTADQAEIYARRLLSTFRRVKVYRDEYVAAQDEAADMKALCEKNVLVCTSLKLEVAAVDQKIQVLLNERQMVQIQFEQEARSLAKNEMKKEEAAQRTEVLRNTIDNIAREAQRGKMLLQNLVPNLQIENYVI